MCWQKSTGMMWSNGCLTRVDDEIVLFNVLYVKVEKRIDLVYGGGNVGLMGLVSQAVHDGGRHVIGYSLSLPLSYRGKTIFLLCFFISWFYPNGFH